MEKKEFWTPEEIASDLGITGIKVRTFIRLRWPRETAEKGRHYILTREQAKQIYGHFMVWKESAGVKLRDA